MKAVLSGENYAPNRNKQANQNSKHIFTIYKQWASIIFFQEKACGNKILVKNLK